MAADSRQQTLESILRWSLRQQDNEQPSATPMDAEVFTTCRLLSNHTTPACTSW